MGGGGGEGWKRANFVHRSFSYTAPSVWNSLPCKIRHIQSATAFTEDPSV